jgi:single-strand DNA-binding protein
MAGSVNKAMIVGCLGKDPQIRNTQRSGIKVVTLTVATRENWKDVRSGTWREHTEWHRVVIMNEALGEIAERFLRKGSKIYAEGKLMTRQWIDQDGVARATTEINLGRYHGALTLLDSQEEGQDGEHEGNADGAGSTENQI